MREFYCQFCRKPLAQTNGETIRFSLAAGFNAEVEMKNARHFDIKCGVCRETTRLHNKKFER